MDGELFIAREGFDDVDAFESWTVKIKMGVLRALTWSYVYLEIVTETCLRMESTLINPRVVT